MQAIHFIVHFIPIIHMLRINHFIYQKEEGLIVSEDRRADEPLIGAIPPIFPEHLGSKKFKQKLGIRFAYVSGAMARGIASEDLVIQVARHGGLGFFGSAGLSIPRISQAIDKMSYYLKGAFPYGVNLIHNLKEQQAEMDQVELFLEKGVQNIEAAAFTSVTPAIVWFAFKNVYQGENGQLVRPHHVFAKISHSHVAEAFMSPPPEDILEGLQNQGFLTPQEVALAKNVPIAECITVESDSGGHTDNRPATALFPIIKATNAKVAARCGYQEPPLVGLAGGIGTPEALSAAYDMGADYAVVGSVHQSCIESGTSAEVKKMLETAGLADYTMTPSADMFEEGIKVQVLKKGTMMPIFGNRLLEIYRQFKSLEELPETIKEELEIRILKQPIDTIWQGTKVYFETHEPSQVSQAETDPHHKMALVFRWYLGKSNQWPIEGLSERRTDFQIWCGPAMGSFNEWVKGSFLEPVENREVGQVMLNLLEGAAYHKRIQQINALGIDANHQEPYFPQKLGT